MPFSVLMSLYIKERPEYLRESLDSVFSQTLPPDEVVLVLDGPITTELTEVVKSFANLHPELKLVPLEQNVGLGRALNEGLKHCSYELVARMDTDDICFPNRFEKQISFMENHKDIDAVSSWLYEFEGYITNAKSIKKVPQTPEEAIKYVKSRSPLNHPAVVLRKSSVEAVGSYQHILRFEDWYLWARMISNGSKLANLQEPLVYFRTSAEAYKRRGGWQYAKDSFKFHITLSRLGLVSLSAAIVYGCLRAGASIIPNSLRAILYNKLARS